MKSVGIITMHCVVNHGSALQTWATQEIIRRLGYDVKIINYRYPNAIHPHRQRNAIKTLLQFIMHLVQGFPQLKKRKLYELFWKEYFALTDLFPTKESLVKQIPVFDIYISGSDQIWNPRHTNGDGAYFLDFVPKGKKKIAYASSFSCGSIEDKYRDNYARWLQSYDAISVRETNGVRIVEQLVGKKVPVTLDPSLLMTQNDYMPLIERSTIRITYPYILVYCLKYMYNPYPYATRFIEEAARQTELKVVCIDFTTLERIRVRNTINYHDGIGPSEFLWLFAHAKMVIATSFHGTAFAVNFGKPVYSIVKDKDDGDDRMKSLLINCALNDYIIPLNSPFPDFTKVYDKEGVQKRLELLRKESLDFLKTSLTIS